jgi:hypothetical protein
MTDISPPNRLCFSHHPEITDPWLLRLEGQFVPVPSVRNLDSFIVLLFQFNEILNYFLKDILGEDIPNA